MVHLLNSKGFALAALICAYPLLTLATDAPAHVHDAAHQGSDAHGQNPMLERLRPLSGAQLEKQFLKEMIQHHQSGVQMAGLAEKKTARQEVRALVQKNIENQTKESKQMTDWLQSWHNDHPDKPSAEDPAMKKMNSQMQELQSASGPAFDQKFLTYFSEHHKGAIDMGKLAKSKGVKSELDQAIDKMIADQTADIKEMDRLKGETGRTVSAK